MFSLSVGDAMTLVASLFIYLLPGLAFSLAATRDNGHLARALPLTIATHFVFFEFAHFVGLYQSNYTTAAMLLVSAALLIRNVDINKIEEGAKRFLSHSGSVVAGAWLVVMWYGNAGNAGAIMPNHDAMNHSYMIRNILETGSQQVDQATRLFPLGAGHAGAFYPLGEHSLIAAVVRLTNSSISGQMNVVTIVLSVALFPYAMTLLCERLFQASRLVKLVAPIVTVLFASVFPFSPLSWGGMAVIVAMAYVPSAAVAFLDFVCDPDTGRYAVTLTLFVGLFVMHNTESITAYFLALVLVTSLTGLSLAKSLIKRTIQIGIGSFLLLVPMVPGLVGGAKDRSLDYQGVLDPAGVVADYVLRFFVGTPQYALLLLVLLSLVLVRRSVTATFGIAWIVLGGACLVAGLWPENTVVRGILKPWYGQVLRLNYNVVYLLVPLVVGLLVKAIGDRESGWPRRVVSTTMLLPVVVLALGKSSHIADDMLGHWYRELVPNTSQSLAAYRYMRDHSTGVPMAMTESDTTSDSTWMFAVAGVRPINATAMTGEGVDAFIAQKKAVLDNIGNLDAHPEVLSWLSDQKVEFFYFDESVNPISPNHETSLELLRSERHLSEVFSEGNAHVFRFVN